MSVEAGFWTLFSLSALIVSHVALMWQVSMLGTRVKKLEDSS